jgi:hypothetical protein
MKKILKYGFGAVAAALILVACAPQELDQYSLGGKVEQLPSDWKVTAVDKDNTVEINFDPCTMIDGENVLGVQFSCPEAGINVVVKDQKQIQILKKVYGSGNYTLYVASITRAGTGTPREVPFTVANNLLLTKLGRAILSDEVQSSGETFYTSGLYIEKNSSITLTDEIAEGDVVLSPDYFQRISDTEVKFLGESGIYNLYYSPTRKIVIIGVDAPDYPDYLICIGKGFAYPSKVYPAYAPNYPQWGMASNLLDYLLYRRIADDTYQVTAMMKAGDGNLEFKAYHANGGGRLTNDWGNGGEYKYADCTFSGVPIFKPAGDGNNWIASDILDETKIYRVTVTVTTPAKSANVKVEEVDWNGEVIPYTEEPEEPQDPDKPIVSTSIDPTTGKPAELDGETVLSIYQTLEKDAEYTVKGALSSALFNLDFFETLASGKVKFLGENGDYHLIFNQIRNNVIPVADDPQFPEYAFLCGVGLGYPTRTPQSVINKVYPGKQVVTLDNWNFDNEYEYILMHKTGDNVYQATVMLPSATKYWWDGGPYASFKVYKAKDTDASNEINGFAFKDGGGFIGTATDIIAEFADVPDDGNISLNIAMSPVAVRIIVDLNNNSMTVNNITLP